MAPTAGSTWDHAADKDLLLTIIDAGGPGAAKWAEISEKMQAKSYTFTKEACRQHFQKIRKEAKNGLTSGGSSPNRSINKAPKPRAPAKSTPRKGKSMADSFATTNSSFSNGNGYNEDDDEEMTTPIKRKRTTKEEDDEGQSAPLFKVEGQGVRTQPIDLERDDLYYDEEDQYA